MMNVTWPLLRDVLHLFYPPTCLHCGSGLIHIKEPICISCLSQLPFTQFEKIPDNPTERALTGRLPIQSAASLLHFSKGKITQSLLHALKYKNEQALGIWLGKLAAYSMQQSGRFEQIDYLLPVPMHPAKEKKRGYNQAALIAAGMASVMQIPVLSKETVQCKKTETQTRKSRTDRWLNVADCFFINRPEQLNQTSILLVDDVLTTGATLEAFGRSLFACQPRRLSVYTIAYADA
jgi:ComF family protein